MLYVQFWILLKFMDLWSSLEQFLWWYIWDNKDLLLFWKTFIEDCFGRLMLLKTLFGRLIIKTFILCWYYFTGYYAIFGRFMLLRLIFVLVITPLLFAFELAYFELYIWIIWSLVNFFYSGSSTKCILYIVYKIWFFSMEKKMYCSMSMTTLLNQNKELN